MTYLIPDACFSLAPGILIEGGCLRDEEDRRYPLNMLGSALCAAATRPIAIDQIGRSLAPLDTDEHRMVRDGVPDFVASLNRAGLASVHQGHWEEFKVNLLAHASRLVSGQRPTPLERRVPAYRRYAPRLGNLLGAVVEGHQMTMWVGVCATLVGVVVSASVGDGPTRWVGIRALGLCTSFYFTALLMTAYVHEFGHLVAAKLTEARVTSIYVRSGAVGIALGRTTGRKRVMTAVAGPVVGLAFVALLEVGILASPGAFWAWGGFDQLRLSLMTALACLGLAQILCFTPLTKDGRTLWSSFDVAPDRAEAGR